MVTNHEMFSEFTEQDIDLLAEYGTIRKIPKNSILINKGDESVGLYLILEGRVKVYIGDEMGEEVILRYQQTKEFFGEMALIDDRPRSASVATVEPSRLIYISKPDFERCLKDNEEIALKLVRYFIQRVCTLTDAYADCALKRVYSRVREKLLSLATEEGDGKIIKQAYTQKEIAGLVGSGREMISRIFSKLKKHGYIEVLPNKQIILKKDLPRNLM